MNFAALSKLMYDEDGMIKAVELAPNGVVRSVYPQASNADALGLDWESFLDEIQINKLQGASYEYLIWKKGHNGERGIIAEYLKYDKGCFFVEPGLDARAACVL